MPFYDFNANQAWADTAALAMNMVSWLQLAILPTGHTAKNWDLKRWRYRLFATAGKLITRARKTWLLLPEHAPEAGTFNPLHEHKGDAETGAHPATTGPALMPKTGKPARQGIEFLPGRQPDHHEKSGLG